jgi:uroporphyrinogen decarboxylase
MNSRERIQAALNHRVPDRVPHFEVWIDALWNELGQGDPVTAAVAQGQDCIMMPTRAQLADAAGKDGIDEWGRAWCRGLYVGGVVDTVDDTRRYSPSPAHAGRLFDSARIAEARSRHPGHALIYGSHIGPFTATYLAMGFDRFFLRLSDDLSFVERLLTLRTEWCLAVFDEAVRRGAEVLVLGDDAAHKDGPMISPRLWRDLVLPHHRRIVREAKAPVIWHSDGNILPLLSMAVEAGFAGVHGLDPSAGMDLERIRRQYGRQLALVGNIDVRVLCGSDLAAVRSEVARCYEQGAGEGGFMISTCNSIFEGMNPLAVTTMFRCQAEFDGSSPGSL